MTNSESPMLTNESGSTAFEVGATNWDPKSFRCHLAIVREADGTYSAIALNLPGAGSCGDTEEEAIANSKEAIIGVLQGHLAKSRTIPWKDSLQYEIPAGAKQKWILVNV